MRTMARTAVVAGTATVTAGAINRHQQKKYAQQDEAAQYEAQQQQAAYEAQQQQYAPPAPAPAPAPSGGLTDDAINKLKELAELKSQGIITDAEFEVQKAKLLNG
jgi:hypothetical protein